MLRYMLDTNILIYAIKNKPLEVRRAFEQHSGQLCTSTLCLMELKYGAEKSAAPAQDLATINGLAARLEAIDYDARAATHSGQIRAGLARSGQPIDPYDQMITGHARSQGLTLVTNNTKEFDRVDGLRLDNWINH
jgi:tRNA(fMet)-specific endonuclease VapC